MDLPCPAPSKHPLPQFSDGGSASPSYQTIHSAILHHSSQAPGALAVEDISSYPTRTLSYSELTKYASYVANELKRAGIKPGSRVPLVCRRSLEMVVGIVGILMAGAQYVPLDGGVAPDHTLLHVLQECAGDGVAVTTESSKGRLLSTATRCEIITLEDVMQSARAHWEEIEVFTCETLDASSLGCYVIYTSGTTGKPKGVDVTHSNVVNLVCNSPGNVGMQPGMKVGSVLSVGFDMGAWEILGGLSNGCTLVLRGSDWKAALSAIDVLIATPTILSKYNPAEFPNIRFVATAGERLLQETADEWTKAGKVLYSGCGPTEVTIVNTLHVHKTGQPVTIGKPTPNNRVYVLDEQGTPAPIGKPGLMWAGGAGVTRGYINLPDVTATRWKYDPFAADGSTMFNTGDVGYWLPNGSLQIVGRIDDQVKIKNFRVELDGVSASLRSCPGVSSAVALMVGSQLCGFVTPSTCNSNQLRREMKLRQPYYAVPSFFQCLEKFPETQNGKIDRQALKALAEPSIANQRLAEETSHKSTNSVSQGSLEGLDEVSESVASGSAPSNSEKLRELPISTPEKKNGKYARGLRYRIMIVYRTLFSLVWIANIAAMLGISIGHVNPVWIKRVAFINLTVAVLIRNDFIINLVYTVTCSAPKSWPLWIRRRCAKIYHLGGMHSGAASAAVFWYTASLIHSTWSTVHDGPTRASTATLAVSWITLGLLFVILASAWPPFRKSHHNAFEVIHRLVGWTAVILIWIQTGLSARDKRMYFYPSTGIGTILITDPTFWLLITITCSIITSWLFLKKVDIDAEVLSDHAVRLHFDYTVPVNGSFTRLSQRPLFEWHSFATVPAPDIENGRQPGYSLVVSNAGDWTKDKIMNPPKKIWARGVPTCGVMRIATLFNRLVIIGTGSGIGPLLGFIQRPSCAFRLIWSTRNPEGMFGPALCDSIRRQDPNAVIHDTTTQGRPDLVAMAWREVTQFGAEGVVVISNEKLTRKVVYGLETRGVAAFGAIWDS
ncbi:hypothetical protein FQN54_008073 [Arachnomyces sp. PD_36]|nr:hypothetical protein FQN54_008073 [Arachnomyces sp. PD_36]